MHDPSKFERRFAARLLGVVGTVSLASVYAACTSAGGASPSSSTSAQSSGKSSSTGSVTLTSGAGAASSSSSGNGGAGGEGTGGTGGVPPIELCFAWPPVPVLVDAGAGDAASDASSDAPSDASSDASSDAGTGGGGVAAGGAGGASTADAGFISAPAGCPVDKSVVLTDFKNLLCPHGWEPYKIVSGPLGTATDKCCYNVYDVLCAPGGRPYLVEGAALVAPRSSEGATWTTSVMMEDTSSGLAASERTALAAAWAEDGAMEHASVASFSRFSLALLAVGAPAELIAETHRAATDEIEHARACFALASRYAGETVAPGRFPLGASVRVDTDLAELAASTVREGCIGETVAAVVASERLSRATDPDVRAALTRIAEDEARHAELAWRTVAWALASGDARVRAAVERAFSDQLEGSAEPVQAGSSVLADHGVLPASVVAATARRALATIVAPSARALLAQPSA